MNGLALVDRLRALRAEEREAILVSLTAREVALLRHAWRGFWARPDVRDPNDPTIGRGQIRPAQAALWWVNSGGRGSGKTEACSRWCNEEAERLGPGAIFHLVGATLEEARETMVEGVSGILATATPLQRPVFTPSKAGGRVVWASGARARLFGAERARRGRGPQCNRMWVDDPAAFGPNGRDVVDQLLFGFRLRAPDGSGPSGVISTTPIASDLLDWILAGLRGQKRSSVVYSLSKSDDNRANLTEAFFTDVLTEFEGSELEQQERYGADVIDRRVFAEIDFARAPVALQTAPLSDLVEIAIWCDPALSTTTRSCEVGISVAGLMRNGHVVALEDLSNRMTADDWPEVVLDAAERWEPFARVHIGVETNRGGNLNEALIRSAHRVRELRAGRAGVSSIEIRTAFEDRGKVRRATPLVRLYRSGQLHHVPGLGQLEKQLRAMADTPENKRRPLDRADAWVYSVLDLALGTYSIGAPAQFVAGPAALGSVAVGARAPLPTNLPASAARPPPPATSPFHVPASWSIR